MPASSRTRGDPRASRHSLLHAIAKAVRCSVRRWLNLLWPAILRLHPFTRPRRRLQLCQATVVACALPAVLLAGAKSVLNVSVPLLLHGFVFIVAISRGLLYCFAWTVKTDKIGYMDARPMTGPSSIYSGIFLQVPRLRLLLDKYCTER